jgi:hypothetical protein
MSDQAPVPAAIAVSNLIPMLHVMDVEKSLAFYGLLGFAEQNSLRTPQGRMFWASAACDRAEVMFAQADGDPDPTQQAILLYLYSSDVAGLREHLLASGLFDGGTFCGAAGPNNGRRVVFEVTYPQYMPSGEIRVADPDGYCLLIGQLD